MKKLKIYSLVVLGIATMLISCSKEEGMVSDSARKSSTDAVVNSYSVNPPYDDGLPGTDAKINFIVPESPDDQSGGPYYPFTIIKTPTSTYKEETCLLNFSGLESNKTYHKITGGKLAIGFYDESHLPARVLKLDNGPSGWNSIWGSNPNVECKNPDVLYVKTLGYIVAYIYLSKPCIEFGFEVAPNHQDYDHHFSVGYGNYFISPANGIINSTSRSPSGASLVAIKATKPFTTVTIFLDDSPTGDIPSRGLAIANIRYKLAN
jgi:hypothetical protein